MRKCDFVRKGEVDGVDLTEHKCSDEDRERLYKIWMKPKKKS